MPNSQSIKKNNKQKNNPPKKTTMTGQGGRAGRDNLSTWLTGRTFKEFWGWLHVNPHGSQVIAYQHDMHPQNSHPPSLTWSRNLKAKLHHVPLTHTEGLLTTMILHSASLWRTFHRKLIKQHLSVSTAVQTNVTVSCPIYNMFAILLINVRQHYSKHTYSEKKKKNLLFTQV